MNREEAEAWLVASLSVSRETLDRMAKFVDVLIDANRRQNLISPTTIPDVWERHIIDSAQLLLHTRSRGTWIDIGSGAGLPGMVVALLAAVDVTLVESRRLRVQFLNETRERLHLRNLRVLHGDVRRVSHPVVDVISARAVASLDALLDVGRQFAAPHTRWVLPKGRSAKSELAAAESSWQGRFSLVPSITDADAGIILLDGVPELRKSRP